MRTTPILHTQAVQLLLQHMVSRGYTYAPDRLQLSAIEGNDCKTVIIRSVQLAATQRLCIDVPPYLPGAEASYYLLLLVVTGPGQCVRYLIPAWAFAAAGPALKLRRRQGACRWTIRLRSSRDLDALAPYAFGY